MEKNRNNLKVGKKFHILVRTKIYKWDTHIRKVRYISYHTSDCLLYEEKSYQKTLPTELQNNKYVIK